MCVKWKRKLSKVSDRMNIDSSETVVHVESRSIHLLTIPILHTYGDIIIPVLYTYRNLKKKKNVHFLNKS